MEREIWFCWNEINIYEEGDKYIIKSTPVWGPISYMDEYKTKYSNREIISESYMKENYIQKDEEIIIAEINKNEYSTKKQLKEYITNLMMKYCEFNGTSICIDEKIIEID